MNKRELKFGLIGAGNVGTSFALTLKRKKFNIAAISDKEPRKARRCFRLLGLKYKHFTNLDVAKISDIILCGTPDDIILKVYNEIRDCLKPTSIFCHFSGSLSRNAFPEGSFVLSLHPIWTFAARSLKSLTLKFPFAIEGDKKAVGFGKWLLRKIGGRYITVATDKKELYHLACVFASNFLWVNIAVAFNLLKSLARKRFLLFPLAYQSLRNTFQLPSEEAITGPIVRGDKETIRRHIARLKEAFPEYLSLYKELSQVIFDAVKERLNPEDRKAIEKLITQRPRKEKRERRKRSRAEN